MTLTRKWMPSPNHSSRGGATVRLIVLHTAEGAKTIEELGTFFGTTTSQVSSHVGIDDTKNTVGEYVKRTEKAWTSANANPVSVNAEMCAFTNWTRNDWLEHPTLLDNCAKWIAEEAKHYALPITKLTPQQAQGTGRGVCQHRDLGVWGGGHHDCGDGFPYDDVLAQARVHLSGNGDDEMGYPDWYFDWRAWYYNTSRDPAKRPHDAPKDIPDWAWTAGDKDVRFANNRGMTTGERDWINWYNGGKHGTRPNVPDDIPDRWWDDQVWALQYEGAS